MSGKPYPSGLVLLNYELIILAQKRNEIPHGIDAIEMVWNLETLWQGSIILWALIGKGHLRNWLKKRFQSFLKLIENKT